MLKFTPVFEPLTEEYLYHFISPEEIFSKYLGVQVVLNRKIISPLRNDKRPTATFGYRNGTLLFTDWNGEFSGNCIQLVQHIENCSYRKAINKIAEDFKISGNKLPSPKKTESNKKAKVQQVKKFKAVWGELDSPQLSYFRQYGITIQTLKNYNVHKLEALWMNSELLYIKTKNDPAVLYLEDNWFKAYFYTRKTSRFYSQGNGIQGLNQLKFESDLLIIQKSLKDVMLMYELGFESIAPPSENTYISELQIRMLQDKYDNIVVIMDDDLAGIRAMNHYKKLGLKTVVIPNCKDATDYCKAFGIKKTEKILNNLIYV